MLKYVSLGAALGFIVAVLIAYPVNRYDDAVYAGHIEYSNDKH